MLCVLGSWNSQYFLPLNLCFGHEVPMRQWSTNQAIKASPPAQSHPRYLCTSPWMGFQPPLHTIVLHPHSNQVDLGWGHWRPRPWKWIVSGIWGQGKAATVPTRLAAPLYVQQELSGNISPSPNPGTQRVPSSFWHGGCNHSWACGKWTLI